jgi:hypothetical protein
MRTSPLILSRGTSSPRIVVSTSSRATRQSSAGHCTNQSCQSAVRQARKNDDEPDNENVPLRLDAQKDEKTLDATEHKGSQKRADERNSASHQVTSAEDCGGDRGKLHRCAEAAVRVANESGVQDTRKRGQQAADDENPAFYFTHFYSPGKARDGIATDRENAISYRSFENHQLKQDEHDERPNYRGVDTGEIAATGNVVDKLPPDCLGRDKRKASRDGISNSLKEKERAQSHKQGGHAEKGCKNTIERADNDPARERAEERKAATHNGSQPEERQRPDSADRSNRYVNLARRDDERLPECDNRQHCRDL